MKENRDTYNRKRTNYNHSSSAYKIDHARNNPKTMNTTTSFDVNSINETIRLRRKSTIEKNKQLNAKKMEHMRQKRIEQKAVKRERVNYILFFILVFYTLAMGVICLQQSDNQNIVKAQISEKKAVIKEQNKTIDDLKISLADSVNMHEIEKVARDELGMDKPSINQIVYITLPRYNSYIEYDDEL